MLTPIPELPDNPKDFARKVHPWNAPIRLWSLREMLKNYARYFSKMQSIFKEMCARLRIEELSDGDTLITAPSSDGASGWSWTQHDDDFWLPLRTACEELDLDSAVAQIDRLSSESKRSNLHRSQLRHLVEELHNRIEDGLQYRQFLYIPTARVPLWENEDYFGEEVVRKIDDARHDIYEACSCLAAGRYDATVYHCVGIMQAGLFAVGQKLLNCTVDLNVDDWGRVLGKIEEAIDKRRQNAERQSKAGDTHAWSQWKQDEAAYAELLSDLRAVNKAWRTTSAHFRQRYEEEHADKVLQRVREFMQHLATMLPEP